MADERVRIEIGFVSGNTLVTSVTSTRADELQERLRERADQVVELEAEDGTFYVAIPHVTYLKRLARESRVGFGNR
jgi:hypothetical protein